MLRERVRRALYGERFRRHRRYARAQLRRFLAYTSIYRCFTPAVPGWGVILMFHNIVGRAEREARPMSSVNAGLDVTPEYLEAIIRYCRRQGYEFFSLDDVYHALTSGERPSREFVCFTFDDGYLSNALHAHPIFKKHGVPFTIYVATGLLAESGIIWWYALEDLLARNAAVSFRLGAEQYEFVAGSEAQKIAAFLAIKRVVQNMDQQRLRPFLSDLFERYGVDTTQYVRRYMLRWEQVRQLSEDRLVTIAAHTVTHPCLSRLSDEEVVRELQGSKQALESCTGKPVLHLAYPYGDHGTVGPREYSLAAQCGFRTATTTEPGTIHDYHGARLTALPRVAVTGREEKLAYFKLAVSGVERALFGRLRPRPVNDPREAGMVVAKR